MFSILVPFFLLLGLGALLRVSGRLPVAAREVLPRLILDATLPALVYVLLARAPVPLEALGAVLPTCAAVVFCVMAGLGLGRALGAGRAVQGALALTGGFCNTAFLGIPVVAALFPQTPVATAAAVLVDTVATTGLLWTLGVQVADRLGREAPGAFDWRQAARPLVQPVVFATGLGLLAGGLGFRLPPPVEKAVEGLAGANAPLVFLLLGLSLELSSLRGRLGLVGLTTAIKLVLGPVVALAVCALLGVHGPVRVVAVLQAGMPTALVSTVIAARYGCDAPVGSAVAVLTTLLSLLSLPLWTQLLQ
jgi:hypothetical protein